MNKLYQKYKIDVKNESINTKEASLWAVFSTSDQDRHEDVVEQNWDLENFKKNPVVVNSHQYGDATEVVGKVENIRLNDKGNLEGRMKFAVDENPKAKIIFDLYAGGFLNAVSVGFIPKEMGEKGEILKSELLEVSTVSVPSNAMALAKRKGVDVDRLIEPDKEKEEEEPEEEVDEEKVEKKENPEEEEESCCDKPEEEKEKKEEPKEKSPACRQEGESKEDCVDRKVSEIMEEEDVDQDQAVAMANNMCETPCNEKTKDEEEEPETSEEDEKEKRIKQKQEITARAIANLCESYEAETRSDSDRAEEKRLINRAVRNLLKEKGQL